MKAGILFMFILFSMLSCKAEQSMEVEVYKMPPLESLVMVVEEGSLRVFIDESGNLLEWDSSRMSQPITVSKRRVVELSWPRLWALLNDPYLEMSTSMRNYLKADSLQRLGQKLPFELPMASSSLVYSNELMLCWPADEEVETWKVEWRNVFDEGIDSSFVSVSRVLFDLQSEESKRLYVRHPISREGSGNFVVTGLPTAARARHEQALPGLNEGVISHLLRASYFEAEGLYTDALSEYVKLLHAYPEAEFSNRFLRNYLFRQAFPPLY